MQACKDVSLIMLRINTIVRSLDLSTSTQLPTLQQLHFDLQEAVNAINPTWAESPSLHAAHTQLLKCFAALVTSLVAQSQVIHAMTGADENLFAPHMLGNSATFTYLCILLHASCNALHRMPAAWSACDYSECVGMQDALHKMIQFLLKLTRSRGEQWHQLSQQLDPEYMQGQEVVILSVPVRYVASICNFQDSEMARSLMPSLLSSSPC